MSESPSSLVAAYLKANPGFDPLRDHVLPAATALAAARVHPLAARGAATLSAPRLAPASNAETNTALLGYQRVLRMVAGPAGQAHAAPAGELHPAAAALLDHGYDSAHKVAALPAHAFVATAAPILPGGAAQARTLHIHAEHIKTQSAHMFALVRDQVASPFTRATLFRTTSVATQAAIQQVPGYDKLFGSLGYCPCGHSASLIGPGAYFVDLMRITDNYITGPNAKTIPSGQRLEDRRSDLFDMPVTAENVDTEVPFLAIVDDVLERNLAKTADAAYRTLAVSGFPFNLPFTLPHARIRVNLDQLGTSLGAVGSALRPTPWDAPWPLPPLPLATEILGLGASTCMLLTAPSPLPTWLLERCYGVDGHHDDRLPAMSGVPLFLERTGLARGELDTLLGEDLSPAEIAANGASGFYINNTGETGTPAPICVTRTSGSLNETLANLTNLRLERISRFVRLSRALGWSFAKLDWIIGRCGGVIDAALIQTIAQMRQVGAALGETAPIAMAALFSPLKTSGQGPGPVRADFFDQIFNNPSILAGRDPYADGSAVPFNPAAKAPWDPASRSGINNEIRSRLGGALQVGDDDLTLISDWIRGFGGLPTLTMDLPTLSLFYRVARMARLTGLAVAEFLCLLKLMFPTGPNPLAPGDKTVNADLTRLGAIADAAVWLQAQPFSVCELEWSLTKRTGPWFSAPDPVTGLGAYIDSLAAQSESLRLQPRGLAVGTVTPEQATAAFEMLAASKILTPIGLVSNAAAAFVDVSPAFPLTADSFAGPDIAADDAAAALTALVNQNLLTATTAFDGKPAAFLPAPVTQGTKLDFLFPGSATAPRQRAAVLAALLRAGTNVSAAVDLIAAAEKRQASAAIGGLATRLGLTPEVTRALLPFVPSAPKDSALVPLVLTPLDGAAAPDGLNTLVLTLARTGLIASRLNLTPGELTAVAANPSGFSVGDPHALTLADIHALSVYKDLATHFQDSGLVLAGCVFSATGTGRQTGVAALTAITTWPVDQVNALVAALWPSAAPGWTVTTVAALRRCFDLATQLSGDAWFLLRLNAAIGASVMTLPADAPGGTAIGVLDDKAWTVLTTLADATLDAVNGRFRDSAFVQVSGQIEGRLLVARRDALLGAVICKLSGSPTSLAIKTPSDLYQFLLLDVEMSGCMTTSKVIQATAAVQLYMQRCRMGLENGVTQFPFDPIWWEWMSSYRIWEVNRKIFLWPENYVDPSLRQKITPPFATLKQRLRQSDLTDTAVEDAYREYFNEVDTLGTLRLVDAYNVGRIDPGTANRVSDLWLFARTGTEPYTYYFRILHNNVTWTPWAKIEHAVPAPLATPVHAFDTPYLFWTEYSTTQGSSIKEAASTVLTSHKSTMKFIRRRPDGSWSPPQALINDQVIGYQVDYTFDTWAATVVQGLYQPNFDLAQSVWHKPIALFVPAAQTMDPSLPKVDRLMTALGFSLEFVGAAPFGGAGTSPAVVPDQRAYNNEISALANRLKAVSAVVPSTTAGRMQFGTLQINDAMANKAASHLTLLHDTNVSSATPVAPAIDRAAGTFGYLVTNNELAATISFDNYAAQPPASTRPPETILLNRVNGQLASIVNVKNQLGWFLLDNADEAFLIQPSKVSFPTMTELVTIVGKWADTPLPAGETYLTSSPITSGGDLTKSTYAFTRLTTQTIPVLAQRLAVAGLPGLLNIDAQGTPELDFARLGPTEHTVAPPSATLDFKGAMGDYFSEIFFHAPSLVACALNASRRFEQARQWMHYIFNPMAPYQPGLAQATDRFWNYLPFRNLSVSDLAADLTDDKAVDAYNNAPFDPNAIAGLRAPAYAKATAMKYISNLLDWADQLFRQFTRETVNEATNLYVMASDLLGPRPREVVGRARPAPMSYAQMKKVAPGGLVPEFLIDVENLLPGPRPGAPLMRAVPFNDINSYFCIPENDEFAAYWDRVADQLYKIRHCMNIDGEVRSLPLFSPPLDVRAVIAAAAAAEGGLPIDPGTAVPIPVYRFEALLARARSLAGEAAQLGAQAQSALEHQDAEALELLRNSQEKALLDLTSEIRKLRVQELDETHQSLQTTLASANARYTAYDTLLQKGLSETEKLHLSMMIIAQVLSTVGGTLKTMAGIAHLVPNVGSPFAMTYGGKQIGSSLDSVSAFFDLMASQASFVGNVAQISAGYERRAEEWTQQRSQADYERKQIQQQIDASATQIAGARQELRVHQQTLAQAGDMAAWLQGKFTSRELYQWLLGRVGAMHYQTYALAYDLARSVERALQYELNTDQTFLQFGYWDNIHKGLTAGEGLQLALNRMERAWLDGNSRTLEIRRTVALSRLDPLALVRFRATGTCEFALTEKLFDDDYPGHYCRKIKTISVSIPAVVGPLQTISATLTQLSNHVVIRPNRPAGNKTMADAIDFLLGGDVPAPAADVLRSNWSAYQQIALSSGLSDSGLFQLDFRDERYLPFEGTGAVSRWRLDMPPATNRIDFDSIGDVIVEVSYTALDGGPTLRSLVTALPAMKPFTGQVLVSIADLQPDAWRAFLQDNNDTARQTLRFTIPPRAVPPHVTGAKLSSVAAILRIAGSTSPPAVACIDYQITSAFSTSQITVGGKPGLVFNDSWLAVLPVPAPQQPAMTDVTGDHTAVFTLSAVPDELKSGGFIDRAKVSNLILILDYQGQVSW